MKEGRKSDRKKSDKKKYGMKKYIGYMGNAVCALSILFVASALFKIDFDFGQITDWHMFLAVCAAGIVLKTGTVYLSGSAWCFWLEFFAGKRCDRKEALRVYAKANIGKYLPGNVMHYAGRNLFAGKLELSQKQIAAASLCEVTSLVLAAFLMGVFLAFSKMKQGLAAVRDQIWNMFENMKQDHFFIMPVFLCIAAGAVILVTVIVVLAVQRGRAGKGRRQYREKYSVRRFFKTFLGSFVIYAAVLAILGLILVFLYWYWAGKPSAEQVLAVTVAYIIAWVLGFVVPGAPGGIGIREMALTLLLSSVMGRETVAVLSVLHRMITVIGDFGAYLLQGCSGK